MPLSRTREWLTLRSSDRISTPHFRVKTDVVQTHTGEQIEYTYQDSGGSAVIVACTRDAKVIALRQYRYPVRCWCWELPAGHVRAGQSALAAAKAELREEAGATALRWKRIGRFYPNSSSSNECLHVFLAAELSACVPGRERTEWIRVFRLPWRRAMQMAEAGRFADGASALALLLARNEIAALLP